MKPPNRAALTIPSGWIVHLNELYDEEPLLKNGGINPRFNDSQDIIWIEQRNFLEMARQGLSTCIHNKMLATKSHKLAVRLLETASFQEKNKQPTVFIDVGWYLGNAREGMYELKILYGDWDNVLHSFETKSTKVLIRYLNYCLSNIGEILKKKHEK